MNVYGMTIMGMKIHAAHSELNEHAEYLPSSFRGPPLDSRGGGGRSIFEINNVGRTLHEINNLLQELFHINM